MLIAPRHVQMGRDKAMLQGQHRLEKAGHPGGPGQVSDIGFNAANQQGSLRTVA